MAETDFYHVQRKLIPLQKEAPLSPLMNNGFSLIHAINKSHLTAYLISQSIKTLVHVLGE